MNTPTSIPIATHADFQAERIDLAAAFRWTARLGLHEAVANHFSLAVSDDGRRFLMNPNQRHFANTRASDLLLLDADQPDVLQQPDAPDPTAWGLHGAIHRRVRHARCVMHVHSIYATVLASLAEWQQAAMPWQRAMKGGAQGDPKMQEFRWMLEELRVSLFAQELKTPMPVSVKRLQKVWESMQR